MNTSYMTIFYFKNSIEDMHLKILFEFYFLVNRFRCPKGWKRLGGSCYYLSNFTSLASLANNTCNHLHSNLSNIIQIRNAVDLLYVAHVLARNNLQSLLISIDQKLLQGNI